MANCGDVADDAESIVAESVGRWGRLDVLINTPEQISDSADALVNDLPSSVPFDLHEQLSERFRVAAGRGTETASVDRA